MKTSRETFKKRQEVDRKEWGEGRNPIYTYL